MKVRISRLCGGVQCGNIQVEAARVFSADSDCERAAAGLLQCGAIPTNERSSRLHSSPYVIWTEPKPRDGIQLCCFSVSVLHTSTVCSAWLFLSCKANHTLCFSESKLALELSPSKMCLERSTCCINFSMSKTSNTAPQSG